MRWIGNSSEGAEGRRERASVEELGVGSIGDVTLVAELAASENLVEAERVKCCVSLTWSRSGRWRHKWEVGRIVMDKV